ncbi:response regulator [Azospirillum sp. RWY-5-1]|uniref:Response regulator n=1 Tax=Azospirillum oleiclasticum TaxID=2735135 RepID=A0ABX2T4K4_9PROT|nr:response regulator [Azospirillum oleiclasticum]NYZ12102.1 response regulator [Azospirillum oleiclasticum]NYZ19262.1 response regulator [Azospirillum oleiclasticum]
MTMDRLVAGAAALAEPVEEAPSGLPDCQSAEDFYGFPARDHIGRFCHRFLDENALTPSELLHSPRHQQSLSNLPTFVSILQQADRAMGRKGALTGLVNEVARLTRERLKADAPADLRPQNVALEIRRLLQTRGDAGRFHVEAALTQHIQAGRSFAEKVRLLLDLAEATDEPDALAFIDRFLGETMRSDSAAASLSGDAPFAVLVDLLTSLAAADKALDEEAPAILRRMQTLLRRAPMPVLQDGLMVALRRELAKPDHFTIASVGDLAGVEAVQREVMALATLAARLRVGDGFCGGEKTEAALLRRGALLVNEDTLHEIIKGRSFIQKLRTLFLLQKMPLPATAERAVVACILQFFESREFAGRLLDCWKERTEKLKGLAEVQRLVLDSALDAEEREYRARQVDDIQSAFIRTQRILNPLTGRLDPSMDAVIDVAKLAADRAFCKGRSGTAAAAALHRQVHRPRFVRGFLLSAQGARERALRAAWMKGALAGVGAPFIDLAAVRALVVDDEEGPRRFVGSVLSDLGLGAVETAVDGRDALDRLDGREDAFQVIVCDWMMPRVSGLDVLRQVREKRLDLPFLMVTALATQKAVERAAALHVTAYIAKPFTPDQLEEKLLLVLTQKAAPGA